MTADTNFDACQRLWREVFKDTEQYTNFYFQERAASGRIYTWQESNNLAAMVHINPYTMYDSYHHAFHPLHYIVGVATRKEYRHRGLMSRLLKEALHDMYADKEAFTYLMPADPAIYTPFDFCYIDNKAKECCSLDAWIQLPAADSFYHMEVAAPVSYPFISDFTNHYMQEKGYNYIFRTPAYYDTLQKQMQASGGELLYCFTPANEKNKIPAIHAVIAYMFENGHCEITELLHENTTSLSEVQYAFAKHITDRHPTCCPDSVRLTLYDNPSANGSTFSPSVMGRILHFESFIKLLHAQEETSLSLCIKDALLPQNNGIYELSIGSRECHITSHLPLPQHMDDKKILSLDKVWEVLSPYLSKFCINDIT